MRDVNLQRTTVRVGIRSSRVYDNVDTVADAPVARHETSENGDKVLGNVVRPHEFDNGADRLDCLRSRVPAGASHDTALEQQV